MTTGKKGVTNIGKGGPSLKTLAASALSQHKGGSMKNQSEVVAKAFAAASKRTGTFASKYAK